MSIWGAFTNSTSAMIAQNSALNTISQNLANVNTNAYKRIDTRFATMLSESAGAGLDVFGVQGSLVTRIDAPGPLTGTGNTFDLAIKGDGFFILNSQVDGSGETLFSRDGSFTKKALDADGDGAAEAYLVDKNGYFVQGWQAAADGSVTATGSLGALKSIQVPEQMMAAGLATTSVSVLANLPAGATATQDMGVRVYDTSYTGRQMTISATPSGTNTWNLSFDVDGGTVTAPATLAVQFDGDSRLVSPTAGTPLTVQWDDGTSQTISFDLAGSTQYAGALRSMPQQNGMPTGYLENTSFNKEGALVGSFGNGRFIDLYKLPVARFVAPNGLQPRNGNLYSLTEEAGDMSISEVTNTNGWTAFVPATVEASNVDIGEEFTKMIVTQKAYSSAATVFKTADEMTSLVRDLKR